MVSRPLALGVLGTVLGLGGYVAGLFVAYPGRAFAITLAMVGVTLLVIGDDWRTST